jgi:cytochrome P450
MKDADGCLGASDASARRLKYMDMVVRETLRLCSPVQALGDLVGKIHQNPMLEI